MGVQFSETWSVQTDIFDGPLDLLLYLVRRDGIDLHDLRIAPIAEAYLSFVDRMREIHLGVAGEYLVMAATLVYLKSLEILPRLPTSVDAEDDEIEDPREALARRLIEFQRYREVSEQLDERTRLGRETFAREPEQLEDDRAPVETDLDPFALLELYHELILRGARVEPEIEVGGSGPDFASCCRRVLIVLGGPGGRIEIDELFQQLPTLVERIVTFIAVLEMARLQWVQLVQGHHMAPVWLTSTVPPDQELSLLVGRVEVVA